MKMDSMSRRKFLRNALIFSSLPFIKSSALFAENSKVVLVRDNKVIDERGTVNADIIQSMIDSAVCELVNEKNVKKAWSKLFKPDDIVGIKTNVWNMLRTPEELEKAVMKRLMEVGVKEQNFDADDRGVRENPVFQKATALINMRPLRSHYWAGIGGCLKNYIMFVEEPSSYHPEYCSDLAAIWKLPGIKDKTRLNVLVALTPLFFGIGPHHYNAKYVWRYYGILAGFDPVALDAVGVQLLKKKRFQFFGKEVPFSPPTIHVNAADTKHKLGVSDLNKINLVRLGFKDDILI